LTFTVINKWTSFYRKSDGRRIIKFLIADATGYAVLLADEANNGGYFYTTLNVGW